MENIAKRATLPNDQISEMDTDGETVVYRLVGDETEYQVDLNEFLKTHREIYLDLVSELDERCTDPEY